MLPITARTAFTHASFAVASSTAIVAFRVQYRGHSIMRSVRTSLSDGPFDMTDSAVDMQRRDLLFLYLLS
jgi:hypothetical protein